MKVNGSESNEVVIPKEFHEQLCREMRVKYQRAGEFLFKYGDLGKLYYVVLEG